ncbi:MAG: adenylate/guanylate cyclase domain-containing protein [Fimbriimonadaceae bacterium]
MSDDPGRTELRNRTLLCSVLFSDIVSFSERSVTGQTEIKEAFNTIVKAALARVPEIDRLALDTGDGIAVCFFGDPEDALLAAIELSDQFRREDFQVRIGLNLGPVRVVPDVEGRVNVIGDGINVAQRIMGFSSPTQLYCTRSFYEVVSRLSDDYARLFEYVGVRRDKHVREHDLYEVRPTSLPPSHALVEPLRSSPVVNDELVGHLTSLLARSEGPIASVVVRRAVATSVDIESAIQTISQTIDHPAEREKFLTAAMEAASR